jgi:hypothetical protein
MERFSAAMDWLIEWWQELSEEDPPLLASRAGVNGSEIDIRACAKVSRRPLDPHEYHKYNELH